MARRRLATQSVKNANPVSFAFLALLTLAFAGCGPGAADKARETKTVGDWFTIKVGDQSVRMQLAIRPPEMEHGLMGRTDLGRDEGMLFIFGEPQQMSFWMHNTPTPLDIGYFTPTGELAEIYPLHPFDEAPVKSRNDRLQFALEMNQGWFHERGVKPGAKLDLKALAAAMKERGFEMERFGLRE
jgi:uncharacterized membrane protein (UPF0127 family)